MERSSAIPDHDLPLWMRRARRGVDWGVLLALAFALIASWTFLTQPDLPFTHRGEHVIYQTATFAAMIGEGRLFPRWIPDALGGYGAPIPHYYPSGAPYLAALIQFFITGDPVSAIRIVYIAVTLLLGAAVYALTARHLGSAGGVLSSVLVLFNPIIGVTLPNITGDFSAYAGLAFMAALLWSVDRVLVDDRPLDGVALALSTAILCLTHIGMTFSALGIAVLYIITYQSRRSVNWIAAFIRISFGIGIAACFWLPAIAEHDIVQWRPNNVGLTPILTFRDLIDFPTPLDPGELLPTPEFSLGIPLIVCAILTITIMALHFRRKGQIPPAGRFAAFFLACAAILIGIALIILPTQTWIAALIALCLAFGGSLCVSSIGDMGLRRRGLLMPLLCAGTLAFAFPLWLSPPITVPVVDVSPQAQLEYERLGFGVATLPPNVPIPTTLNDVTLNRALVAGYESGAISKIISDTPGSQTRVGLIAHNTHSDIFQVTLLNPSTLDYLTAYFPGWAAALNDQALPLVRSESNLMQVVVNSPNAGTLTIRLDSTPIRLLAWAITWVGVALTIGWTIIKARRTPEDDRLIEFEPLTVSETRLLGAAILVFALGIGVIPSLIQTQTGILLSPQSGYRIQDSTAVRARTNDGLELLAFQLNQTPIRAGDTLDLTLYWRTARFLPQNNRVRLLLLNLTDGSLIRLTDARHPGGLPTRRWISGRYISDPYSITLPADLPSGSYSPALEVLSCAPECNDNARSFFFAANAEPLGFDLVLPIVLEISRP